MGHNPKNFVYVIQVNDYTDDDEEHYLLSESFLSRAEARKCLAAEAHWWLDHHKRLTVDYGDLDESDDEIVLADKAEPNYFAKIEILELELYNTFNESEGINPNS